MVERCIWVVKRQWHCLHGKLRVAPPKACKIICACLVLYYRDTSLLMLCLLKLIYIHQSKRLQKLDSLCKKISRWKSATLSTEWSLGTKPDQKRAKINRALSDLEHLHPTETYNFVKTQILLSQAGAGVQQTMSVFYQSHKAYKVLQKLGVHQVYTNWCALTIHLNEVSSHKLLPAPSFSMTTSSFQTATASTPLTTSVSSPSSQFVIVPPSLSSSHLTCSHPSHHLSCWHSEHQWLLNHLLNHPFLLLHYCHFHRHDCSSCLLLLLMFIYYRLHQQLIHRQLSPCYFLLQCLLLLLLLFLLHNQLLQCQPLHHLPHLVCSQKFSTYVHYCLSSCNFLAPHWMTYSWLSSTSHSQLFPIPGGIRLYLLAKHLIQPGAHEHGAVLYGIARLHCAMPLSATEMFAETQRTFQCSLQNCCI